MNLRGKIRRLIVFVVLVSAIVSVGQAQSSLGFYHLNDQFNVSGFNPAFLSSQKNFTVSIFPLAGIDLALNNGGVIKDVTTSFFSGNQSVNELRGVFTSLEQGLFLVNYESNLLNLGYYSHFGSFNFRIKENVIMMTDLKGNLSDFLTSSAFNNLVIGPTQLFAAEAMHYREYSLGYGKEIIKNKLTVGVRAKLYFGKSFLSSEVSGRIIERSGAIYLQVSGPMRLSIPANPMIINGNLKDIGISNNFNIGSYLSNAGNIGTGLDLGIKYEISPELELSASVVDLGKINWKKNIHTLIFKDEFQFSAHQVRLTVDQNGVPILTKLNSKPLVDTISFKLNVDESAFSKALPTYLYFGLKYQLNSKLSFGLVDRYIKLKGLNQNSISLTPNYELNKKIVFSIGYSSIGISHFNVPMAILYKWEGGQSYLGTDNVLSILLPSYKDFSGISFGTCFFLFNHRSKYKKQLEYLPFYKEKRSRSVTDNGLIFNSYPNS